MSDLISMIGSAAGIGGTYLMNEFSHRQQLRHQQDFTEQQLRAQESMSRFNQGLALDTWEKTNYDAQVKQMEKAGLNVGLMYGKGAAGGGTTNFGGSQSVTGAQATAPINNMGMGLQLASQLRLMEAQKENIEADTALKLRDAGKKGAEIPNVEADTELKRNQIALTSFNTKIAEIQSRIAEANESNSIGMLNEAFNKLQAETKLTQAQEQEAKARVINLGVSNALMQSGILKNQSDIEVNKSKIAEISNNIEIAIKQLEVNKGHLLNSQDAVRNEAGRIFQEQIKNQFHVDTWAADKLLNLGSMLLGGMIFSTPKGNAKPEYKPNSNTSNWTR